MANSNPPRTDVNLSRQAPRRSGAAMLRHEAETVQFLALVECRRPGLAALLAFARSRTILLGLVACTWALGSGQFSLQSLTALFKSL